MNENDSRQSNQPDVDPKIVVDDDWKAQVDREKQQMKEREESHGIDQDGGPEIPDASFQMLVTMLATQTMSAMGLFPDPATNEISVDHNVARHLIDTLAMLEEKTKGNLDQQESLLLNDILHQLRMTFVTVQDGNPDSTTSTEKTPSIELP